MVRTNCLTNFFSWIGWTNIKNGGAHSVLVVALVFFAIGTVLIAAMYDDELKLLTIMAIFTVIYLACGNWRKTKHFFLAFLFGGVCENVAVMFGIWNYSHAHYLPVPLWLPFGWGLAVVFLDEILPSRVQNKPHFSWKAILAALAGTFLLGIVFTNELLTTFAFVAATIFFFLSGKYGKDEVSAGSGAAVLCTVTESVNILAGNWHYTVAVFGTPLWLPLCWFNAFLIMRRIIHSDLRAIYSTY